MENSYIIPERQNYRLYHACKPNLITLFFSPYSCCTLQFLDEADLLADHIAVLAIPGKLVANGSPVALKRDLGSGYSVQVSFTAHANSGSEQPTRHHEILERICAIAPEAQLSESSTQRARFRLRSKDSNTVEHVLRLIDSLGGEYGIVSYDVIGSSIEEVFLDLMIQSDESTSSEKHPVLENPVEPPALEMKDGRTRTPLGQALTIFHKRALIARRSWLAPLLMVMIAVAGCCAPLFFMADRQQSCTKRFWVPPTVPLRLPDFVDLGYEADLDPVLLVSPPDIASILGHPNILLEIVPDNASFLSYVDSNYQNLSLGGVSFDLSSGNSLLAWEASSGLTGPALLNLATNTLLNHAFSMNASAENASLIDTVYWSLPYPSPGTLSALKWAGFFGLAMVGVFSSIVVRFVYSVGS